MQLDEHDSLSPLFTQNIYNDFLSCVTILYYISLRKLWGIATFPMTLSCVI